MSDPAKSKFLAAVQAAAGVAAQTGYRRFRFVEGESLLPGFPQITPPGIDGSGDATEGHPTKIDTTGSLPVTINPEEHALLLAAAMGADVVTDIGGLGLAYLHKLTPHVGGNAFAPLTLELHRDDGMPQINVDTWINQVQLSIQGGGMMSASFGQLWGYYSRWGLADQLAGASTEPVVQGIPRAAVADLADGDLYVKVVDVTGLPGSIEVETKVGAGSAYSGATSHTVTPSTWVELADDQTGDELGTLAEPVKIRWEDFTGIALNDEWRIRREAAEPVSVLPTLHPVNEIYSRVLMDAEEFVVQQATVTYNRPFQQPTNVSGRFRRLILERGLRTTEVSFSRELNDSRMIRKLEQGTPFAFVVHGYTGDEVVVGNTATRRRISAYALNCRVGGQPSGISAADTRQEQINATAHPSSDVNYPDALTLEAVNSIADLAA